MCITLFHLTDFLEGRTESWSGSGNGGSPEVKFETFVCPTNKFNFFVSLSLEKVRLPHHPGTQRNLLIHSTLLCGKTIANTSFIVCLRLRNERRKAGTNDERPTPIFFLPSALLPCLLTLIACTNKYN